MISNFVFACSDVLDKYPLDEVSEATYWSSPKDLELYINQFYPSLRGNINFNTLEAHSDNLQPITPSEILDGTRSVPSSGGGWGWGNIREINYFLENAPKVTEGIKTELDQYKGEGYFFRAYYYFDKVRRFGDVPWYDEVLNIYSEGLMAPRDPRNIVVDNILADLDKAISMLQDKSQIGTTRINRETALAFKSRVALYEGTWEKYHQGTVFGVEGSDGSQYLQIAADAAKTIIDEGNFQLYSTGNPDEDYFKLFNREDLSGNPEVLLMEVVEPELDLGTWVWTYLNGIRGGGTGITRELVSSYLATDGLPISLSSQYEGDTTLVQVVTNRDPRLQQTMWVPGQVQIESSPDPLIYKYPALHKGASDMSTTGYMIRKGSTPDPEQNQGSSSSRYGDMDGMVFRYAEVLLNYAEAKAELGTITQADLDISINLIRARVGMPNLNVNVGFTDPEWSFPNLSPIINEIRRERRIELALEGYRLDDLMRWAAADLIQGKRWRGARFIKGGKSFPEIEDQISDIVVDENNYIDRYQTIIPQGFGFDEERDYLFPVPTNERSLNPNLSQNPNW